jgi:hypothetical protein
LLQNLYPLVVDSKKGGLPGNAADKTADFNKYVNDFCSKYGEALEARTKFI